MVKERGHESNGRKKSSFGMLGQWERILLLMILLLGAGFDALYLAEIGKTPEIRHPPVDEGFSLYWARTLATGDMTLPPEAGGKDPGIDDRAYLRPPGYPFVLAFFYRIGGGDPLKIRIFQMFFGLLSVILAFFLGRRMLGPPLGLTWAALMALNWPLLYFRGALNGVWLLVLLSLALLIVLHGFAREPGIRRAFLIGGLVGLLALVRSNALVLGPVLLGWGLWILWKKGLLRRVLRLSLAAVLGGFVVLAPTILRNWRVEGALVPISANGGLTLYHGNNDDSRGFSTSDVGKLGILASPWVISDIVERLERETGRELSFSQASKILGRRALEWIRENPKREFLLVLRRTALFWGPDEIAHNHAVGADRQASGLLRNNPLGFPTAFAGAIIGLAFFFFPGKNSPGSPSIDSKGVSETFVAAILITLAWFFSFLPFFATSLYRAPLIVFLLLGTAYALVRIFALFRSNRAGAAGWVLASAVVLILVHIPLIHVDPGKARRHYDRGVAWIYEGQPEKAEKSFETALKENPLLVSAHNGLGKILMDRGDIHGALRHFSRGVEIRPKNPVAQFNLGLALAQSGSWKEAERAFEEAVHFAPGNAEAWVDLGVCRELRGDLEGAAIAYDEALNHDHNQLKALNNLAWLLATSADPEMRDGRRALSLAQTLVQRDPSPSHLDTLAAAQAETGLFEEAAETAGRALRALPLQGNPLADELTLRRRCYRKGLPFHIGQSCGGE